MLRAKRPKRLRRFAQKGQLYEFSCLFAFFFVWFVVQNFYVVSRNLRAAATMLTRAGRTSSHLRVFKPQSGLTHS